MEIYVHLGIKLRLCYTQKDITRMSCLLTPSSMYASSWQTAFYNHICPQICGRQYTLVCTQVQTYAREPQRLSPRRAELSQKVNKAFSQTQRGGMFRLKVSVDQTGGSSSSNSSSSFRGCLLLQREWLMRRRSYGDSVSARNREQILQRTRRLKVRNDISARFDGLPIMVYLRHEGLNR